MNFIKHCILVLFVFMTACTAAIPPVDLSGLNEAQILFYESAMLVNREPAADLVRWNRPILLSVVGFSASEKTQIIANITKLALLVGVEIEVSDLISNYIVRKSTDGICKTELYANEDTIFYVNVYLVTSRLERCTNHEGLHAMGLRGHPVLVRSVLSYNYTSQTTPTENDLRVLKALYRRDMPLTGSMRTIQRKAIDLLAP